MARILVAEDEEALRAFIVRALAEDGHETVAAADGAEALDLAQRDPFDLILLDLMMEGMDGFEVAARLQSDAATADVPVVVLTAKAITRGDRERLRGKIEALVGKSDMPGGGLVSVIEGVLSSTHQEGRRV